MTGAHDTPVRVRLLGPVQAWRDDEELDLGTAHRRAVLTVLAMRANHAVPREELIAAVWGDSAPASAAGSVYTYVSALRGVLEPGRDRWSSAQTLTSTGGGYCLRLPVDSIDALRFGEVREQTRAYRASGDSRAELEALQAALSLWQGEALAGIPGPYAENQRRRLGELRLSTIERHATLLLGAAGYDEVIATLAPLIADHPLRESLHGLLMTALVRRGRSPEALDVYRMAHRTLVEQTGTEPSTELRRLHERILAGELGPDSRTPENRGPEARSPEARPARTPVIPRQRGAAEPVPADGEIPFVGREPQLARLRQAVAAVAAGRGGCVWIEGEPGIGKTALLTEGLRDATAQGCRVGWGVGDELAQRVPLTVLIECLDLGSAGDPAATEALALAAATAAPGGDPTGAVLERVQALVLRMCTRTPVVLVVDDVQWADEASLLAWHSLYRLTARVPLLLVAAARPTPRSRRLDLLRGVLSNGGAAVEALPPFDAQETADLVRRTHADPALAGPAGALAAGNPLYLTGILAAAAGRPAPWLSEESGAVLPAPLTTAVWSHLELLAETTRDVVRAAAFLGDSATVGELATVTGRSVSALIGAVQEALSTGVLSEAGGERLAFRHPLVRRVLHESTPTALRVMLHREFAEKLAAAGAIDRVAEQLLAAGPQTDAWAHRWLADHVEALRTRAPEHADELLARATGPAPGPRKPPPQAHRFGPAGSTSTAAASRHRSFLLSDGN
jgi:DNA-binding SARP family transcriptional activator